MLEIAGGILIAFAIIAVGLIFFESILSLLAIGIALCFAASFWFVLTMFIGWEWASMICLSAFGFWLCPKKLADWELFLTVIRNLISSAVFWAVITFLMMILAGFALLFFGNIGAVIGAVAIIVAVSWLASRRDRMKASSSDFLDELEPSPRKGTPPPSGQV